MRSPQILLPVRLLAGALALSPLAARADENPPRFEISAGAGVFGRKLAYRDIVTRGLQAYELPATPIFELGVTAYALQRPSWGLGLTGGYARSLGFSSETSRGETLSSSHQRWQAGLRFLSRHGASRWGAQALLSGLSLSFEREDPSLPAARALSLQLVLDGEIPAGPLRLGARGGGGWALAMGPFEDRFPRLNAGVLQGAAWVALPLPGRVQLRGGAEVLHFFMKFNPEPGDPFVAGGAVDQFARIFLDATLSF